MKEIAKYKSQFSSYTITTVVYSKNDGVVIDIITPNEHLGGIGVGIPYKRKNGNKTANSHAISMPAHRDAELASKLAQIIAKYTEMNTVVIMGIHLPDISTNVIEELIKFFETWFNEIGVKLAKISF